MKPSWPILNAFRFRGGRACLPGLLVVMFAAAPGCSKPPEAKPPPPPAVTFSLPIEREVIQWDEYSGTLSSPDAANVAARVSGLIEQAPFREGTIVRKGDVLFVIDPRPFQADLDSKKADLARANSQQDLAQANLRRLDKVRGTRAISEEDYDTAKANLEQAKAAVAAANAALETSQLNFNWTRVTAPITGRVGRMNVQVGNLVTGGGANQATMLTTIVSIDPIYCYVQVPEQAALRYQDLAARERAENIASARIPCYLELENETTFGHEGYIDFLSNQVDVATGTEEIRGVFANPGGTLWPGIFARMRIPGSGRYRAILIPDLAIGADQNERFVLIVGPNDTVERRRVELGALFGTLRAMRSGVKPGDRIIVNGLQQARPGAKVVPHEAPISTAALDQLEATASGSPTTQALPEMAAPPATAPASVPAAGPASRPAPEGRP